MLIVALRDGLGHRGVADWREGRRAGAGAMPVTFEAEFKTLLCGALTLVTAVVIVRDLVVGVSGFSGVYPLGLGSGRGVGLFADNGLRYASAAHLVSYGTMIILKISLMIFFGAETLHLVGLIADDPILILKQVIRWLGETAT